jgi:hypothetical protein
MTPADLAAVLAHMPDSASLTLTVPELRELIQDTENPVQHPSSGPEPEKKFFSTAEVSSHYRISIKTLERRRKEGAFPGAFKQGRPWLYPASALRHYERWLVDEATRKATESPAEPNPSGSEEATDVSGLKDWKRVERGEGDNGK